MNRALLVDVAGPLTTVQDVGRPGLAHLGISPSGAADRSALRRGNAAVGNPPDAAGLEVTLGSLTGRARGDLVVALAGMAVDADVDGRQVPTDRPVDLGTGSRLRLRGGTSGVRCYLAVRGGIDVDPVLGSRSTDLLAGLGPPIVRAGAVLPVGNYLSPSSAADELPGPATDPVLRVVPGPRDDWFDSSALDTLTTTPWAVDPDSNRVGVRLRGPRLARLDARELPSEGLTRGAVQVPPSGQPVVLLADHPVTGGYPVLGVVVDADVDHVAQLRPGTTVRFSLHPAPSLAD